MDKKALNNFLRTTEIEVIDGIPYINSGLFDYTVSNQGYGPEGGSLPNPQQNCQIRLDCALTKDLTEYEIPMPTPCLHKSGLVEVTVRGEQYYTCPTIDCTIYNKDQEFVQNHVDRIKSGAAHPVYCRLLKEEGNRYRPSGSCGDYVPAPNQHKEYDDAVECVNSKRQMNIKQ